MYVDHACNFSSHFSKHADIRGLHFGRAMLKTFAFPLFTATLYFLLEAAVMIVEVYTLGRIILFLQGSSNVTETDAYLYAMGLSIAAIVFVIILFVIAA